MMRTTRSARVLLTLALLSACARTEYSHEVREPGRVEQITYTPGANATGIAMPMGKGAPALTSTTIPDRYAIVFSCPHGKFTLKPEGDNAQLMFQRLKEGDSVTITYREEYKVFKQDGREVKELVRLDFIDAHPRD